MAKQQKALEASEPHALYRFFGAGGTLLYIGITNSIPARLKAHNGDKAWWLGVTNITVEHYPNRVAVLEAERRAIRAEKPLYNDKHNEGGLRAIAAEPESGSPGDSAGFWLEGYLMTAHAILDTFPTEQVERYKRDARIAIAADGNDRLLGTSLEAATLLGPAAITAFHDVYGLMVDMVRATEHLYMALPDDLRVSLRAEFNEKLERNGVRDLPRLILEHLTDRVILNGVSVVA